MENKGKAGSFLDKSGKMNLVLNDDPEFWMTRLPAPLKDMPIIHLAIPGTFKTWENSI
jgi:hypothetical protein